MSQRNLRIEVPVMARVEGEGSLAFSVNEGRIEDLRFSIFEPPRYFEKFLEGREYTEIIDIVARICGICPVAYQMSATRAIEQAFGLDLSASETGLWIEDMRRVMYCGEWIQSHALHIHLLAAPDFLGKQSALELAEVAPEVVRRGLALQTLGNDLIALFGGRSVHPVGLRPGGFHRAPDRDAVAGLLGRLKALEPEAEAVLRWTASLDLPDDDQAFVSVGLAEQGTYAIESGIVASDRGLELSAIDYERHFREYHEPHSTALYSSLDGEPYLVGPLARMNLGLNQLGDVAGIVHELGIGFPSRNMFHSIVARAAEMLYVIREAIRLLSDYRRPQQSWLALEPRESVGMGATEAPRGLLWHRYGFDANGLVTVAKIVPPTAQNQGRIEQDLRDSLEAYGLDRSDDELRLRGEMVIRNYDPCISCATHFLRLRVDR